MHAVHELTPFPTPIPFRPSLMIVSARMRALHRADMHACGLVRKRPMLRLRQLLLLLFPVTHLHISYSEILLWRLMLLLLWYCFFTHAPHCMQHTGPP